MIANEVVSKLVAQAKWFAVEHWDVAPRYDDDGKGIGLPRMRHWVRWTMKT